VVWRSLNVANHFAVDPNTIQKHQSTMNLSGFTNQCIEPFIGGIQGLVFELFKHDISQTG
jgi:hypothetical protein